MGYRKKIRKNRKKGGQYVSPEAKRNTGKKEMDE